MPSFEDDAFARAQQMHRRTPYRPASSQTAEFQKQEAKSESKPEPAPISAEKPKDAPQSEPAAGDGLLNTLFKNKEQSLILLLIILLMEENSEPTLLLALIYLLI